MRTKLAVLLAYAMSRKIVIEQLEEPVPSYDI
jgi:hypothetical protein